MLIIDGSFGEGGGQIIRSSLALSLVTGTPVAIENIRARRSKPGLRRQHLTAVRAAAEVGRADLSGAALGSTRLVFRPSAICPGRYTFDIGSAGSTTLVLQTVLPALMLGEASSTLELTGGTHNPHAPPFDFLAQVYLPLLNRMGPDVEALLDRPGFYPAGGGRLSVAVTPAERLHGMELLERGQIVSQRVRALVSNLPRHIAERECRTIVDEAGWEASCCSVEEVPDAHGPGNVVMIEISAEHAKELFISYGEPGIRAEQVARCCWNSARHYLNAGVPVGEYLADQLLLPMGIAAHRGEGDSAFRTTPISAGRKPTDIFADFGPGGRPVFQPTASHM